MELKECRKGMPDEVQARHRRNGASLLLGISVGLSRQREADPVPVVAETGAPDDVRDVDDATVRQHRLSVLDPDRPLEDALHARGFEIGALDPDERAAVQANLLLHLATHRRVDIVRTRVHRKRSTGHATRIRRLSRGTGIWPVSLPERTVA